VGSSGSVHAAACTSDTETAPATVRWCLQSTVACYTFANPGRSSGLVKRNVALKDKKFRTQMNGKFNDEHVSSADENK
jgi:hypothetical protein